jgi:5-methylcytosine-specific restriction protein A
MDIRPSPLRGESFKERKTIYRERSNAIKLYALKRANGTCEACQQSAPFVTADGRPFLEVHHLRRLSDGGPDHPQWVAAVCPNCHRRAHYGQDAAAFNKQLLRRVQMVEVQLVTQDAN